MQGKCHQAKARSHRAEVFRRHAGALEDVNERNRLTPWFLSRRYRSRQPFVGRDAHPGG